MNPLAQAFLDALDEQALDALVDLLADRVADRLVARSGSDGDGWMDTETAAGYLGMTVAALHKLTAARTIPIEQAGPGCKCWFNRSQFDEWRRGRRTSTTPADAAISLPTPGRRRQGKAAS